MTSCPTACPVSQGSDKPPPPILRYGTRPSTDRAVRAFPWRSRDHVGRPRQGRSCIHPEYRGALRIEHQPPLDLQGRAQARTSGYSAPARRPRTRENGLWVFRYVASISLNLHSPHPKAPMRCMPFGRFKPRTISSRTRTLRRRYGQSLRIFYALGTPHFPDLRVITRARPPFTCFGDVQVRSPRSPRSR